MKYQDENEIGVAETNPHFALWQSERYESPSEAAYERFLAKSEKALGLPDLDGHERYDGYSLDFAYEAFERGVSAEQYVADVRKTQERIARATHQCSQKGCMWAGAESDADETLEQVIPSDPDVSYEQKSGIMCPVCSSPLDPFRPRDLSED